MITDPSGCTRSDRVKLETFGNTWENETGHVHIVWWWWLTMNFVIHNVVTWTLYTQQQQELIQSTLNWLTVVYSNSCRWKEDHQEMQQSFNPILLYRFELLLNCYMIRPPLKLITKIAALFFYLKKSNCSRLVLWYSAKVASTAFCSIGNKSDAFLEKLEPPLHLPQHSRCRKNIAVILYTICVSIFIEAPPPPKKKMSTFFHYVWPYSIENANNHRGGQSKKKKTADGVSDIHRPNFGVKLLRTILHTSQTKHTQKKENSLICLMVCRMFFLVSRYSTMPTPQNTQQ